MKKTIALMLAMLFAVCAFATTAFADPADTDATQATEATQATTESTTNDDVHDGMDETTTTATTTAATTTTTTEKADDTATTTKKDETTTAADVTATLAPGETAYEGQGSATTTKKPANVDTTIPSTGSGIVVPAIALAVLAAGTVAVIKTKKED